ncbi:MAG: hypothetical protein HPY50_10650 [Firmicutes bacterium]|nr:hypothetical protein [Bacillota bacterium]
MSEVNSTFLHPCNPWVVVWWSAAFPGLGQLHLGRYVSGLIVFIWELTSNSFAHINTAIFYSLTGQFQLAKEVLNKEWLMAYVIAYVFAMWVSYESTVEMNKLSVLADREESTITPMVLANASINYLAKRKPGLAAVWSAFAPGMGQLYSQRIFFGFFLAIFWLFLIIQSNLFEAAYFTMVGDFKQSKAVLDLQWLLFMPSIYGFGIYNAYVYAASINKIYETEQARYLKKNYQPPGFRWMNGVKKVGV